VSPWWSDATRIVLLPDGVAVARLRYRIRPRLLEAWTVPASPQFGGTPWQGPVDALQQVLARIGRGVRVSLVVSNSYVRLALVPWQPGLVRQTEREAFARHHLKLRFGEIAADAPITLSAPRFGAAGIACTIDAALWAALDKTITAGQVKLDSAVPLIGCVFDAFSGKLKEGRAALAILEPGYVTFVFLANGQRVHVVTRKIMRSDGAALANLLTQELAAAATPFVPERVLVYSTLSGETSTPVLPWPTTLLQQQPLPGFLASRHSAGAVALCGAAG